MIIKSYFILVIFLSFILNLFSKDALGIGKRSYQININHRNPKSENSLEKSEDVFLESESVNDKSNNVSPEDTGSVPHSKNRRTTLRKLANWGDKIPLWFFPYKRDSYLFSTEFDYEDGSMKNSYKNNMKLNGKGNGYGINYTVGYAFRNPYFLTMDIKQKIQTDFKYSISSGNSTSQNNFQQVFDGISEPKISFGRVWNALNYAIGFKIGKAIPIEEKKITRYKLRETSSLTEYGVEQNSVDGGPSNHISIFSSYEVSSDWILDLGIEKSQYEKVRTRYVEIDNIDQTTTVNYNYYPARQSSGLNLGLSYKHNFQMYGLHLIVGESDHFFQTGESLDNASDFTKAKQRVNGVLVEARFDFDPKFKIRPSVFYTNSKVKSDIEEIELTNFNFKVSIDFNY